MTTVFIWNNNEITFRFAGLVNYEPGTHEISGHASMSIDDRFVPIFDLDGNQKARLKPEPGYVSWMPDFHSDPHTSQKYGYLEPSFFLTLMLTMYAPDTIIRIPEPPAAHLERMRRMRERHDGYKEDMRAHHFDIKKKNCSRVCSRVLRAGWNVGHGNIRYGQIVSGLWTPLMVKRLALSLKGGATLQQAAYPMSWEELIRELYGKGVVGRKTAFYLSLFKRRASNRGSSGATPRFTFLGRGSMQRTAGNYPLLLPYCQLREAGLDKKKAFRTLEKSLRKTNRFHIRDEKVTSLMNILKNRIVPEFDARPIPADFMNDIRV